MTLLSIVQGVCDEAGISPRPATVIGNTDQLARQMLALANRSLRHLSKEKNWPILTTTATFNTAAATETYAPPADFRAMVANTAYNAANYAKLRGGMTPSQWATQKRLLLNSVSQYAFRYFGGFLHLNPTPTAIESLTYEYISTNYAQATGGGAVKALYAVDTDVSRIDEDIVFLDLKWRIKAAKGLAYEEDYNEAVGCINSQFARETAYGDIPVGGSLIDHVITDGYVRENGYGV